MKSASRTSEIGREYQGGSLSPVVDGDDPKSEDYSGKSEFDLCQETGEKQREVLQTG
jgi:hypothetical protein